MVKTWMKKLPSYLSSSRNSFSNSNRKKSCISKSKSSPPRKPSPRIIAPRTEVIKRTWAMTWVGISSRISISTVKAATRRISSISWTMNLMRMRWKSTWPRSSNSYKKTMMITDKKMSSETMARTTMVGTKMSFRGQERSRLLKLVAIRSSHISKSTKDRRMRRRKMRVKEKERTMTIWWLTSTLLMRTTDKCFLNTSTKSMRRTQRNSLSQKNSSRNTWWKRINNSLRRKESLLRTLRVKRWLLKIIKIKSIEEVRMLKIKMNQKRSSLRSNSSSSST